MTFRGSGSRDLVGVTEFTPTASHVFRIRVDATLGAVRSPRCSKFAGRTRVGQRKCTIIPFWTDGTGSILQKHAVCTMGSAHLGSYHRAETHWTRLLDAIGTIVLGFASATGVVLRKRPPCTHGALGSSCQRDCTNCAVHTRVLGASFRTYVGPGPSRRLGRPGSRSTIMSYPVRTPRASRAHCTSNSSQLVRRNQLAKVPAGLGIIKVELGFTGKRRMNHSSVGV